MRRGRSAPTKNQPKRSAASIHGVQPGAKGKAKKGPDQKLDESVTLTTPEGEAITEVEKEAIQKRAEGRTKVPPEFTDSIKKFFFSPTGALKIARLVSRRAGSLAWAQAGQMQAGLGLGKPSLVPLARPPWCCCLFVCLFSCMCIVESIIDVPFLHPLPMLPHPSS